MNPLLVYVAGIWGMLSVMAFSDHEFFGGVFKLGVSVALLGLAVFFS